MSLKITAWNANGLCQHAQEIKLFLNTNNVDILLVSETRMTENSNFNIFNYKIYKTNHPDGTAHGGSAVIIRNNINHHEVEKYEYENIQATTVEITTNRGKINVSAVYCPPKYNNKKDTYGDLFKSLGNKFILGGDFNVKHTIWG